ncbi:hypothetical protein GWK47_017202 [Chionoecetes opilio]|uniref:Uncharacterized protein n=1 Tax=Chionoecetes opilio TaxID=41210 RepID=A0A8J4XW54_CHIOP|nr:hypothetical protein GWK47_017202 [Chionoecetes opilio]
MMASPCKPSGSRPATRQSSGSKLAAFVGGGREFAVSEVPTYRGVMKRGILLQELSGIREGVDKRWYPVRDIAKDLTPMVLAQWNKSSAQLAPPVVVIDRSVTRRIDNFGKKVSEVVRDRATKKKREFVEKNMDSCLT